MYLKKLSVSQEALIKALSKVERGGRKLAEPDYRIDPEYQHSNYPGRTFLAIFLPPDRAARTQFFCQLAYAIGIDEATRLAQRSRTVETDADMVIYFPDVALVALVNAA
jgi:hypothetical protein